MYVISRAVHSMSQSCPSFGFTPYRDAHKQVKFSGIARTLWQGDPLAMAIRGPLGYVVDHRDTTGAATAAFSCKSGLHLNSARRERTYYGTLQRYDVSRRSRFRLLLRTRLRFPVCRQQRSERHCVAFHHYRQPPEWRQGVFFGRAQQEGEKGWYVVLYEYNYQHYSSSIPDFYIKRNFLLAGGDRVFEKAYKEYLLRLNKTTIQ
eukprot:scaffold96862_cov33-Prasinocladus_malaysianus.AAC.1